MSGMINKTVSESIWSKWNCQTAETELLEASKKEKEMVHKGGITIYRMPEEGWIIASKNGEKVSLWWKLQN